MSTIADTLGKAEESVEVMLATRMSGRSPGTITSVPSSRSSMKCSTLIAAMRTSRTSRWSSSWPAPGRGGAAPAHDALRSSPSSNSGRAPSASATSATVA